MQTIHVDSVIANVCDLDGVLTAVFAMTGLTPFVRTTVTIRGEEVPLALVMFGDTSLEFIGCGKHAPDAAHSQIASVTVAVPEAVHGTHALEPGLLLTVQTGPKPVVLNVTLHSTDAAADTAMLDAAFGFGTGPVLNVNGVALYFQSMAGETVAVGEQANPDSITGWRRVAFSGLPLQEAVACLTDAGAAVAVPPFRVMPGLWEAMYCLPSGLVVQPVEQQLWKMLPAMAAQKVRGWLRRSA